MKILYLTISNIESFHSSGIYGDLISSIITRGHKISVISSSKTFGVIEDNGNTLIKIVTGQVEGNKSLIAKALNLILLSNKYKKTIKKYFNNEKYDLIIYATPPITLNKAIEYAKKKYKAKTYLMLKDIFPQNAVYIEILKKTGIKGIIYKFFKKKEKKLYKISDRIGCMSKANCDYLLKNNNYISKDKVEIFPNSIDCSDLNIGKDKSILKSYGIPDDKLIFIYGGNLGIPQGVDYLIAGIKKCAQKNCCFVIIGGGSKKQYVKDSLSNCDNVYVLDCLPRGEYEKICRASDIGLVMLDSRFTIPNYPSRILSYMSHAMPVMACTDKSSDIKDLVETEAKCGRWCYSGGNIENFENLVDWFLDNKELNILGENGKKYLENNFNVEKNVKLLESFVEV